MTTSVNWNGLNKPSFDAAETKINNPLFPNLVNFEKIPQKMNLKKNGASVTIKGVVPSDVNRFSVELIDTSGNIGLHISLRFPEGTTIFNSYEKERTYTNRDRPIKIGGWAQEEVYQELVISPGESFEILISTTNEEFFVVQINWMEYQFKFRAPPENLKNLKIEGDVLTTSIQWDGLSD